MVVCCLFACWLLFVVSCSLFAGCHVLCFVDCCGLFVVCCLVSRVVCCLLFVG